MAERTLLALSIHLLGEKVLKAPSAFEVPAQEVRGEGKTAPSSPQPLEKQIKYLPAGPLSLRPAVASLSCMGLSLFCLIPTNILRPGLADKRPGFFSQLCVGLLCDLGEDTAALWASVVPSVQWALADFVLGS